MQVDVTEMLLQWGNGDQRALDRLLPILYEQLKKLAHARLRAERAGHTLNTTGLVHEAYLRLVDVNRVRWHDRNHFLAMASRTMRRILIDYARDRRAQKRGRGVRQETLRDDAHASGGSGESLLEIDDALRRFERQYPRQVQAVELRYFGGLTLEEAAEVLGVTAPTVMRDVRFAQAWIAREWAQRSTDLRDSR